MKKVIFAVLLGAALLAMSCNDDEDTFCIEDSIGDFECASGELQVDVLGKFIEGKLDFTLTGTVCGGCE